MLYAAIAIVVIVIVIGVLFTAKRNKSIKQDGIEADAVVTRVKENESTNEDGFTTSVSYTYYVTYRTLTGQTVEAQLASGKSFDIRTGKKVWDQDLHEGSTVRIKYLPDKPDYVIRIYDHGRRKMD